MRILVVNWNDKENPFGGGAEVHLHEIFGRIASSGNRVDLLASGWSGSNPRGFVDGIDIHRVGTRYTFPFHARRYYRDRLAAQHYDVIVEDLNKIPLYTPRWGKTKVVALVHHLFGPTIFREAMPPMAAAVWIAERGISSVYRGIPFEAVSESTAEDLEARGIPRKSVKVIYNGMDTEFFMPEPGSRSPFPLFSYVGRLKRYKGVNLILQAFAKVDIPGSRLEIAGAGDFRDQLEELTDKLNLRDRVRFLGYISPEEKRDLLRRSWATVFASPKEGWGLTNLEAQACGTPAIASNSPGLRESLIDGETGFLVPHADTVALAAAMKKVATSRDVVEKFGSAGRRFAETFTWDRAAAETLSHLQHVVQRGK
ncbi:MAG TPA: glycosyltransferase family 4 protein [Gemmatimonadaceae bacterium]|nr:glycosyltransferase family 4 protein [Gemmatimonadaceae bacterium]